MTRGEHGRPQREGYGTTHVADIQADNAATIGTPRPSTLAGPAPSAVAGRLRQLDLAEAVGVGHHLDGGDPPVREAERERHPGPTAGSPDEAGDAVEQGRPGRPGATGERVAHGRRPRTSAPAPTCTAAVVGAEDDVGVEQGHQGVEVAVAGGGRLDHPARRVRSAPGSGSAPCTRRRARLASWRAAARVRPRIPRSRRRGRRTGRGGRGEPLGRGQGVQHHQQRRPDRVGPGRASRSGSAPSCDPAAGSSGGRPGLSRGGRRGLAASRATPRATTGGQPAAQASRPGRCRPG